MQIIRNPNSKATAKSRYATTCIVTGRSEDDEGFIDTRKVVEPGNRPIPVVISAAAVKEMARKLDWVPSEDVEGVKEEVQDFKAQLDEVENELADLKAYGRLKDKYEPETAPQEAE